MRGTQIVSCCPSHSVSLLLGPLTAPRWVPHMAGYHRPSRRQGPFRPRPVPRFTCLPRWLGAAGNVSPCLLGSSSPCPCGLCQHPGRRLERDGEELPGAPRAPPSACNIQVEESFALPQTPEKWEALLWDALVAALCGAGCWRDPRLCVLISCSSTLAELEALTPVVGDQA